MQKLTDRQNQILKIISNEYCKNGEPISSKYIASLYGAKISSQTIRNELANLEKLGYLEKVHTSSGRVPSKKGLEYFNENASCNISNVIKNKLESIFVKRENDIDNVINDSLIILNEITSLPSITNTYIIDENLREVSLIQLNENNSMMLIVTSLGNIYKNYIEITNQSRFEDTKVCINLFNKFLIGTPLIELENKIQEILPIIKKEVNEYEYITQQVIKKLFEYTFKNIKKTNVVGVSSLFQYPEFSNPTLLHNIINMLETGNVWKQIKHILDNKKEEDVKIEFRLSDNNDPKQTIMVASTFVNVGNEKREISVVGPSSRVEFGKIKSILNYIKTKLEDIYKK